MSAEKVPLWDQEVKFCKVKLSRKYNLLSTFGILRVIVELRMKCLKTPLEFDTIK